MWDECMVQSGIYVAAALLTLANLIILEYIFRKKRVRIIVPLRLALVVFVLWNFFAAFQSLSHNVAEWSFWNLMVYAVTIPGSTIPFFFAVYLFMEDRFGHMWSYRDPVILLAFTIPLLIAAGILSYVAYVSATWTVPNLWFQGIESGTTGYGLYHEVHGPLWDIHIGLTLVYATIFAVTVMVLTIAGKKLVTKAMTFFLLFGGFIQFLIATLVYVWLTHVFTSEVPIDITPIFGSFYYPILTYSFYRYDFPNSGKNGVKAVHDLESGMAYVTMQTKRAENALIRFLRNYARIGFRITVFTTRDPGYWTQALESKGTLTVQPYVPGFKCPSDIKRWGIIVLDVTHVEDSDIGNMINDIYDLVHRVRAKGGTLILMVEKMVFQILSSSYLIQSLFKPILSAPKPEVLDRKIREITRDILSFERDIEELTTMEEKLRRAVYTRRAVINDLRNTLKEGVSVLEGEFGVADCKDEAEGNGDINVANVVREAISTLHNVTEELDTLSRMPSDKEEKDEIVDVVESLKKALNHHKTLAKERRISIALKGEGKIWANPIRIERISMAMVEGVIHASKPTTDVEFQVNDMRESVTIEASFQIDTGVVSVVTIPLFDASAIDPNKSLRWCVGGGTAVYMYILFTHVRALGGRMEIRTDTGETAVIYVEIRKRRSRETGVLTEP